MTSERPHATGIACGLSCADSVCNSGDLAHRHGFRCLIRVAWWLSDIEHCFPQENPERIRTFLVSLHCRNWFQLESQDDFDQEISGRKTVTITHVRRVGMGHPNCVPERLVCHTTTSHVSSMVRQ